MLRSNVSPPAEHETCQQKRVKSMRYRDTRIGVADVMLIAPCGLHCGLCRAHIRNRRPCPGCRGDDDNKSNACITCAIKNCQHLAAGGHQFCFSCTKFPCPELRHLDHRYRTKYGVSAIANLERIEAVGIKQFVADARDAWSCSKCGTVLCMHKPQCVNCGQPWRKQRIKGEGEKVWAD